MVSSAKGAMRTAVIRVVAGAAAVMVPTVADTAMVTMVPAAMTVWVGNGDGRGRGVVSVSATRARVMAVRLTASWLPRTRAIAAMVIG